MHRSSIAIVMAVACVAACSAEDEVLRQGSRGEAVRALQARLVAAGHRIAVDGIYGPNTAAAVRAFQRSRSLPATGRADATTQRSLARPLQRG
ncbi:MAG: peptidoglycan-binding protein, partial [Planctomycetes bacterium]|nr:peptidoglycan-binding protein [Planctomycetota bacterium]